MIHRFAARGGSAGCGKLVDQPTFMHDLSFFRNNFDAIAARLATRSNVPSLDRFRELDHQRRAAITETEQLKARVNEASAQIGKLKRENQDTTAQQEQVRADRKSVV